jgi:two-component system response regulator AtoC
MCGSCATVIEHGVVMSNSSRILLKHLPIYLAQTAAGVRSNVPRTHPLPAKGPANTAPQVTLPEAADLDLNHLEIEAIREALHRTGDNRTEAAKVLGISRRTLQRKLKELGLVRRHRPKRPAPEGA